MPSAVITLTTDFGSADGYAAAMKGVILSICPGVTFVDISHEVPPQDIAHAAFVLGTACPYFPGGAVHLAVVDPGVGTERQPLCLVTPDGAYVAPDNGILTYVIMSYMSNGMPGRAMMREDSFMQPMSVPLPRGCAAYALSREEFWRKPVSYTFHGRDIFAPAAAHLAAGVPPEKLGDPLDRLVCLNVPRPQKRGNTILGRIIYVDRFGNLVSNIRLDGANGERVEVEIEGRRISGLSRSYAGGPELLAIIGSHGYLEVAVRNGSAMQLIGAGMGSRVKVVTLIRPRRGGRSRLAYGTGP